MDTSKEALIQRLLKNGKISQDEAYLLSRKEIENIPQSPAIPFPPIINKRINPYEIWMQDEMNRRQRIAENCPCNPAKGGSGICGCTLTGPVVTC